MFIYLFCITVMMDKSRLDVKPPLTDPSSSHGPYFEKWGGLSFHEGNRDTNAQLPRKQFNQKGVSF